MFNDKFQTIKQNYKSIVWAIIILILSVFRINTSDSIKEYLVPHSDKLVHIFLYTVFSFLLLIETEKSKQKYICLLYAFLYGVLMELFQHYFTIYRSFELYDILANTTGVLVGFLIYKQVKQKLNL